MHYPGEAVLEAVLNAAKPTVVDRNCLAHASAFQELSEQRLGDMLDGCRAYERPAGAIICRDGDPADELFLLVDGIVQLYYGGDTSRHAVLHIVEAGETFGEPAALVTGRHTLTAQAVTDIRIVEVPAEVFRLAIAESPSAAIDVITLLVRRLMSAWDSIEALQTSSTTVRLAKYLLRFCDRSSKVTEFDLPFDKGVLAASLGMKPESLSRSFAKLRPFGVKSQRRHVVIKDPEKLAAGVGIDYRIAS